MSKIKYTVVELNKPNPMAVESLNKMVFKIITDCKVEEEQEKIA
ncbi:hypothetical protein [Clostridium sp.]|jgi:hypothetical protein|nr:hypothetical protein [Clostridium sp.]MDF2503076.1 hypothetical protein [Clostridium sp.]